MDWPAHLLQRAIGAPDPDLGIIAGSTPVVAFGDPVESWLATLGINPSRAEFLDASGALLDGDDRRLATLPSLGVDRYEDLTPDHARAIVDDCASYFDRRPSAWFTPLGAVITEALGATYADRSACHLDLVQWATRNLWGELPAEDQMELLRRDVGFLRKQLTSLGHRTVVVNGRSVMRSVERAALVRWRTVATLAGPPTAQFSVGTAGGTTYLGWTCNLQSQHGATVHADRLAALVAEHAPGRRRAARGGGTTSGSSTPPGTARGRHSTADSAPPRPPRPPAMPGDAADGGPMPQGLHFTGKGELVAYLSVWLRRSTHPTIGDIGTYGGSAWCTVDSEAGRVNVNRDTTREAVEALVAAAEVPRSYEWLVVANRNGRVNRVLFSEDRTQGWYAYLGEPLERETRLGRRSDGAGPGRADTGLAAVVHFPHPGGEHVPPGNDMGWNRGLHARKFLACPGTYIDDDGVAHDDELVFWGEWEAPSRVVRRWTRRPGLPTVVHEPYWTVPATDAGVSRRNTDPWVFGDTFLYSNCRQLTPNRRPSALQRLPVGSLILFGSTVGGGVRARHSLRRRRGRRQVQPGRTAARPGRRRPRSARAPSTRWRRSRRATRPPPTRCSGAPPRPHRWPRPTRSSPAYPAAIRVPASPAPSSGCPAS